MPESRFPGREDENKFVAPLAIRPRLTFPVVEGRNTWQPRWYPERDAYPMTLEVRYALENAAILADIPEQPCISVAIRNPKVAQGEWLHLGFIPLDIWNMINRLAGASDATFGLQPPPQPPTEPTPRPPGQ